MDTGFRLLVVFFLLGLAVMRSLEAQELPRESQDVEVRLFLIDIESINSVSQSFTANLVMVLRWRDSSLAHDGPDSISMPLDEIWYPRVQILNQQRLVSTFPQSVEIHPDGEVVYRQRVWGSFSQPLELKTFPFDSQRLLFTLANVGFGAESVNLITSPRSATRGSSRI